MLTVISRSALYLSVKIVEPLGGKHTILEANNKLVRKLVQEGIVKK
jgi:hypothetical protein